MCNLLQKDADLKTLHCPGRTTPALWAQTSKKPPASLPIGAPRQKKETHNKPPHQPWSFCTPSLSLCFIQRFASRGQVFSFLILTFHPSDAVTFHSSLTLSLCGHFVSCCACFGCLQWLCIPLWQFVSCGCFASLCSHFVWFLRLL